MVADWFQAARLECRLLALRGLWQARAVKHRWPKRDGLLVYYLHGAVDKISDPALEHSFTTLDNLRQTAHFLKKFPSARLSDVEDAVTGKARGPSKRVLVTFDDGFQNCVQACEMLRNAGISVALYATTGLMGSARTIWPAEVTLLVLYGGRDRIEVPGKEWRLATRGERERAQRQLRQEMKAMPASKRKEMLSFLLAQHPPGILEELVERTPTLRMMTWDEVRYLRDLGVEIGAHGVDHEILHEMQEPEVVLRELCGGKSAIERELGEPCWTLAYPNGAWAERWLSVVREAGFRIAFTTVRGAVREGHKALALPRIAGGGLAGNVREAFYEARW